ncbi:serine hydrolase [Aeoliella sp. SH292]|uniref:serine hydrolase n=1 Tax=Aeoliella sp. SH292 TaxID=3454464 RepID=UPI003F952EBF
MCQAEEADSIPNTLAPPARCWAWILVVLVGSILLSPARGQALPEAGPLVSELTAFDDAMRTVMTEQNISAGVAAIMRNGNLIYRRAFGWDDAARTVPIEENATMRIASVTKPLTAATIRNLIADGHIGLHQRVFSLDEPGTGILDHTPFGNDFDPRLKDITVNHLLQHRGGWDREMVGDWTYAERTIASDMGVASPPGREATLNWILGNDQGLQFSPGSRSAYSNIGYMVLGLIAEEVTGLPHIEAMHQEVFRPMGVPDHMIQHGRTFAADQDPREPHYMSSTTSTNVFWNSGNGQPQLVSRPYGGWHHEARIGQGAIVADPIALLEYMQVYTIAGSNIGAPRPGPGNWSLAHTGGFEGTSVIAMQRGDGTDYVIMFNKAGTEGDASSLFSSLISGGTIDWPTLDIRELDIDVPGDLTGDGEITAADIDTFIANWRMNTSDLYISDRYRAGDMNFDGIVDLDDVALMREAIKTSGLEFSFAQSVPELSSLVLASMLLVLCAVRPSRRPTRRRTFFGDGLL